MLLTFRYAYQGTKGEVHAKSVAQAIDRIEVAYLAGTGIRPSDPKFRLLKKQLPRPWRIDLAEASNAVYRLLYRNKKDGEALTQEQSLFFEAYSRAANDLKALWPTQPTKSQVTHV